MLLPMQCSKSYFNLTSSQCFTDFRPASDIPHIYEQHLHVNQVLSPLLENRLLQKPPPPHSRHSSPHFRHIRAIFYTVNIFISYLTVWRYSCNILRRENWENILLRTFILCHEHWAALLLSCLKISWKFAVGKKKELLFVNSVLSWFRHGFSPAEKYFMISKIYLELRNWGRWWWWRWGQRWWRWQ